MDLKNLSLVQWSTKEVEETEGGCDTCFWLGVGSVAYQMIFGAALGWVL